MIRELRPEAAMPSIQTHLYFRDLSRAWQAFFKRCLMVGYGEMLGVRLEQNRIVSVEKIIRTRALSSSAQAHFDPLKPLSERWVEFYRTCQEKDPLSFHVIRLEAGVPVSFRIDEGGWRLDDMSS